MIAILYRKKKFRVNFEKVLSLTVAIVLAVILTSCNTNKKESSFKKFEERVTKSTYDRPQPDDRGIITFDTYQVIVSRGGETIFEISERLRINANTLALYNGLIPNYKPRNGEILALPNEINIKDGSGSNTWSTEIVTEAIESTPSDAKNKTSSLNNPLRHRVELGETVYSIARLYNVSVTSLASWNGLGPDLDIKPEREIIIPAFTESNEIEFQEQQKRTPYNDKPTKSEKINKSLQDTNVAVESTMQVNKQESKEETKTVEPTDNIEIISVKPFIKPVEGSVVKQYFQGQGSKNNNGIDYSTATDAPVKAVAAGVVVLISDIAGGKGKIILIKHANELITIYGRLKNVLVLKGQRVSQKEKIAEVMDGELGEMPMFHFEVRKGMKSIDPNAMFR